WQSLQQNLPVTSVRDIDVHGDDVVIATHGRGFWIMDDVSALRQMSDVRPGAVTLFAPAAAIRLRTAEFTRRRDHRLRVAARRRRPGCRDDPRWAGPGGSPLQQRRACAAPQPGDP